MKNNIININTTGNVGLTTNPTAKLHVSGSTHYKYDIQDGFIEPGKIVLTNGNHRIRSMTHRSNIEDKSFEFFIVEVLVEKGFFFKKNEWREFMVNLSYMINTGMEKKYVERIGTYLSIDEAKEVFDTKSIRKYKFKELDI